MLQEFFNLLDLPSSSVRDLVGGENPFDQWASPLSGDHRLSGAQLVSRYTGASPDSWGSTLAGFGAEMVLDPTNLIGGLGLLKKALAARRANAVGKVTSAAELITDPVRSSPLREDFGQRRIPQIESDYETFWHGTGKNWPPEPDFPLGKPRGDMLLQGTGGNREGPGLYVAQRHSIGKSYHDLLSKRENVPPAPEARQKAKDWLFNHVQQLDPQDPRFSRISSYGDPHLVNLSKENFPADLIDMSAAYRFNRDVPPADLQRLGGLRDSIVSLRDELARETGLAGETDIITVPKILDKLKNMSPVTRVAQRDAQDLRNMALEYSDKMDEFKRLSDYIDETYPVNLPPEVMAAFNPPYTKSGSLYELAVPKKKLNKFMYGDKPVEDAVAHIPEAANYPVAVKDAVNQYDPLMTGSRSVYHGDNQFDVPRAIAENFGIQNPTGADAQRILTETFGISGNKYLDAASRTSTNSPTYNHVIWDPEMLEGARVRRAHRIGVEGTPYTLEQSLNPMLRGETRITVTTPTWSPGTERLLNRKAAATLALYNMAARQGGYTVE